MSERIAENKNIGPFVLAAIFLIVVIILVFIPRSAVSTKLSTNALESFTFNHSVFEDIVLEADVSYIADIETGKVVYQKNADVIRPLASLTKIMTAYTALEVFPEDSKVQIARSDLRGAGDHGLVPGEVWNLEDLLAFMLVTSSNDAAIAIGRAGEEYVEDDFATHMTQLASDLGYKTLTFKNTSGLDVDDAETIPGAVGSAEDISQMFMLAYEKYPEVFNPTKDFLVTLESDIEIHNIENTNIALNQMPGIVGSKTGYTQTAGGNLSVVTQINNKPHVVTVLQSSREGRFEDVSEIINIIQKNND